MNKKSILTTIFITAVVMFIITTCFYVTPMGKVVYTEFLSHTGDTVLSKISKAEYIIDKRFMGETDKKKMSDNAMTGFVSTIDDAYTDYLPANIYRNMTESLEGSYKGIGVTCGLKDNLIIIRAVAEGSPAMKAGIEPDDIIVSINGKEYDKESYSEALNAIKSAKMGESVFFKIRRGDELLEREVKIAEISRGYVKEKILEGNIGYVRVKTFTDDITDDFEKAIEYIREKGARSLIIDLRSNPGGSLDAVLEMTDRLVGEGVITTVKYKDGNEEKYTSDKNELDLPMCVLINSKSASASEIMAGALEYYGKAILVGEKTYGKGVVQAIYEFDDKSAMRLTIAKYFTPSGECIDGVGIKPDYKVPMPDGEPIAEDEFLTENDIQLKKAVEVLTKGV